MPLTQVINEVKRQCHADTPFERIEAFIESQGNLDADERAALWLLAWSDGDLQSLSLDLGRVYD